MHKHNLVTLLVALAVLVGWTDSRGLRAEAPHAVTPPHAMPARRTTTTAPVRDWQLTVSMHGKRISVHPIEIAEPDKPMTMDQKLTIPDLAGELQLVEYTPHASVNFELRRDVPDGKPALRLHIEGPKVNVDKWVIAGDLNHAVLKSQLANWTAVIQRDSDQVARFVESSLGKKEHHQALMVSTLDGKHRKVFTELEPGTILRMPEAEVTVKVLRYMPWCSYDLETKKTANVGDKPINPALEIVVTVNGTQSTHLVFSRQNADRAHLSSNDISRPVQLRFHQATAKLSTTPEFSLFVDPPKDLTLVTVVGDAANAIGIEIGSVIGIPNSPYRFHVAELVERAELVEQWKTREQTTGKAAVQVRYHPPTGQTETMWIAAGRVKRLAQKVGFLELAFVPATTGGSGMPLNHPPTGKTLPAGHPPTASQ